MAQEGNRSETSAQPEEAGKRLPLILTVSALAVAVISAGLFLALRDTTDEAAVDRALNELRIATQISDANSDLAASLADLSPRTAGATERQAGMTLKNLSNLVSGRVSGNLRKSAESSRSAAAALRKLADFLAESENLRTSSTADEAEQLQKTSKLLVARFDDLAIGQLIGQSSEGVRAALKEAETTLENEGSLSEENRRLIARIGANLAALAGSDRAIDDSLDRTLREQAESLEAKRYDLLSVTGPYDCGDNSDGKAVVINEGTMTCEEAIAVTFRASSGSEPAEGWICDITATTLDGFTLDGASGRFCVNEGQGTRVSVYDRDAAAQAQESASSSSGRCGPGEDWVRSWGVPNSGRCVVAEVGGDDG